MLPLVVTETMGWSHCLHRQHGPGFTTDTSARIVANALQEAWICRPFGSPMLHSAAVATTPRIVPDNHRSHESHVGSNPESSRLLLSEDAALSLVRCASTESDMKGMAVQQIHICDDGSAT